MKLSVKLSKVSEAKHIHRHINKIIIDRMKKGEKILNIKNNNNKKLTYEIKIFCDE